MLAIDLETTSADPEHARIVTAAAVLVDGGRVIERSWLSDVDGHEIPAQATAIHGVTTARAYAEGRPAREVIWGVLEAITTRPSGASVVAFVARYDLTVIDREAHRHGLPGLNVSQVVDPHVIDKHLDRYRPGPRTLAATCAHYQRDRSLLDLDAAHSATADALAAARLAYVLGRWGRVIRRVRNEQEAAELAGLEARWEAVRCDLSALHEAQAGWAREQAEGLAEHFRQTGKADPATVQHDWPWIPAA